MKNLLNRFVGLPAALLLVACGEQDHDREAHEEEDPGEHACEAFEEGEAMGLEGAPDRADAPLLEQGEEAYEVSLDDGAPRYVRLRGPTEGLLFVAGEDVVNGLYQAEETEDLLPEAEPNEFCGSDIPEHFDVELGEGEYFLELAPSALPEVWLLFTTAEGHGHEE